MADFDAIVVGAGCAGSVAAYELARAGKSVLMVERGNEPGSKNMTGGRLYTHALAEVFPDFATQAPLERKISHERISLMAPDANLTVDFSSEALTQDGQESYSVLRADFDPWLSAQAEAAGAEAIYGIAVEGLLKQGSCDCHHGCKGKDSCDCRNTHAARDDQDARITGIRAGGDEITADVVILCDGANSLLAQQAVGFKRPSAEAMAVGIKQVIGLPSSAIEERLLLQEGQGAAWLFVGDATKGHVGGGFLYTNNTSISLGLVATIADLARATTPLYQMLEDFKAHPAVAPLIKGGKVLEHSGHLVPEGGFRQSPRLVGNGVMLAGECAMMGLNLGYMVRGMDFAIAAGMHAGRTAASALDAGDTSAVRLLSYRHALDNSFVLRDLKEFSRFPHFMEQTTRLFNGYPALARDVMNSLFVVDGSPQTRLRKAVMPQVRRLGYLNVLKDMRGAMKAL